MKLIQMPLCLKGHLQHLVAEVVASWAENMGLYGMQEGKKDEHTRFDTPSTARSIKPNIRIVHVNLGK